MIDQELLDVLAPKTYTEGGKGKKQCPACNMYVGARVLMCGCGHEFIIGENVAKANHMVEETPELKRYAASLGFYRGRLCHAPAGKINTQLKSLDYNGVVDFLDDVIDEYDKTSSGHCLSPDGLKYIGGMHLGLTGENLEFYKMCVDQWYKQLMDENEE